MRLFSQLNTSHRCIQLIGGNPDFQRQSFSQLNAFDGCSHLPNSNSVPPQQQFSQLNTSHRCIQLIGSNLASQRQSFSQLNAFDGCSHLPSSTPAPPQQPFSQLNAEDSLHLQLAQKNTSSSTVFSQLNAFHEVPSPTSCSATYFRCWPARKKRSSIKQRVHQTNTAYEPRLVRGSLRLALLNGKDRMP